jgi:xylulokinase
MGISSQGEAFTILDKKGRFLSNAMVSSDTRAHSYAENWSQEFGEEKLYSITGHTAHPMFTLFKLLWLEDNRKDIWKSIDKILCFEDLLQYKLGLIPCIGWPLAGRTMLFDIKTHQWSPELCSVLNIDPIRFATPKPSGTIVGEIPRRIAQDLSLTENVLVVTGGHDQPCGALGAGIHKKNLGMYSSGTVECISPAFSEPIQNHKLYKNNLCTYDHTLKGNYTTVAFSLTGGNLFKWFRDQFAQVEYESAKQKQQNIYSVLLKNTPPEPTGLLVLPYFTPSGTPYFDINTPGALLGLRLNTTRYEILKAMLEGVTLEMKLNLSILAESGIQIKELRMIGGGAQSKTLTQLKADILNTPITTVHTKEAGCLGTAMMAYAAVNESDIKDVIENWVQKEDIVEPDPKKVNIYEDKFRRYKEFYKYIKEYSDLYS